MSDEKLDITSLSPGRIFELDCLGFSTIGDDTPVEYADYFVSLKWTMEHQPEGHHPEAPALGWNQCIFEGVRRRLPERLQDSLRWYIAIGSSFDQWHGVDAFFYLNGAVVTVDATTAPEKARLKADFLLTPSLLDVEKKEIIKMWFRSVVRLLMKRHDLLEKTGELGQE